MGSQNVFCSCDKKEEEEKNRKEIKLIQSENSSITKHCSNTQKLKIFNDEVAKNYRQSSKKVIKCLEDASNFSQIDNSIKSINLLLMGDSDVGKSCLIYKIQKGIFETYHIPTIKVEIFDSLYTYSINENKKKSIFLNFIDTVGMQEYENKSDELLQSSKIDLVLFIYDISNISSFKFIKEFRSYFINKKKIIVIGNKIDLIRGINNEKKESIFKIVHDFFDELKFEKENYLEISVKTGYNINLLMKKILDFCE